MVRFSRNHSIKTTLATTADINNKQNEEFITAKTFFRWWWKQTHIQSTAKKSSYFLTNIVSLEKANRFSLSELEKYIKTSLVKEQTRKFLEHIADAKLLLNFPKNNELNLIDEDIFLSAYIFASKPEQVFEEPDELSCLIIKYANEMLLAFEELCKFMTETYIDKISDEVNSPMSPKTPSANYVLHNLYTMQSLQAQQRMINNQRFMDEGRPYLEKFHKTQIAYYITRIESLSYAIQTCITEYLYVESKLIAALQNPYLPKIETSNSYSFQQQELRDQIFEYGQEQEIESLEEQLEDLHLILKKEPSLAANSTELLFHKVALDSEFILSKVGCTITPQTDVESAINGLNKVPAEVLPLLDVLEELRLYTIIFCGHNANFNSIALADFNKLSNRTRFESEGIYIVLYKFFNVLLDSIKTLETNEMALNTTDFQKNMAIRQSSGSVSTQDVNFVIDYIYSKLSNIHYEIQLPRFTTAKGLDKNTLIEFEKNNFQKRISENSIGLGNLISSFNSIIKCPAKYRDLCSPYVANHVTQILCLNILEKPEFNPANLPVTFFIDYAQFRKWHEHYQTIFYAFAIISCIEDVCKQHGLELIKKVEEITPGYTSLKSFTNHIILPIKGLLKSNGKALTNTEENDLFIWIENIYLRKHKVAETINERLRNYLIFYIHNGTVSLNQKNQPKLYGLDTELGKLAVEIIPVLRIHVQVYKEFYEEIVKDMIWYDLHAILKNYQLPFELPQFINSQRRSICEIHSFLHKFTFLLVGLMLLGETFNYCDYSNITSPQLDTTKLKNLAKTHGLINSLNDSSVSKDMMKKRFFDLVGYLSSELEIELDKQTSNLFYLAKENTHTYSGIFLNKLEELYKKGVVADNSINKYNLLLKEFEEETNKICVKVKEIKEAIKKEYTKEKDHDPIYNVLPKMRTGR